MSTACTPTPSACRASSTASLVPAAPTPTTSGTRPPTILVTSSIKRLRSSLVRCEASPVLPRGEMPSTPVSIKCSITASVATRSTSVLVVGRDHSRHQSREHRVLHLPFGPDRKHQAYLLFCLITYLTGTSSGSIRIVSQECLPQVEKV